MFTINVLNAIATSGLAQFTPPRYQLDTTDTANADAIILRSQSLHDRPVTDKLKAIARAGAGVNNIPVEKMSDLGIIVFNTPGANANAVKELVIAAMLLASRHLCSAWLATKDLTGPTVGKQVEQMKKQFAGSELPGKRLAIIGLGAIGVKVANCAQSLGMNVFAFDPHITIHFAWQLESDVVQAGSMAEALTGADFVSVHVPALKQTHHLIDAKSLALLKPSGQVQKLL